MTHVTSDAPAVKTCTKCGESKPATTEYFYRYQRGLSGLRPTCRVCHAEYCRANRAAHPGRDTEHSRAYRKANRERVNEYKRNWRKADPERVRAFREADRIRTRIYREAYPERVKKSAQAWREANKERTRENARAWRKANSATMRDYKHRRRARKRNAEGTHTSADIERQYKAQKGRCYYAACGHSKLGDKYHVDHVVPLSRGGSDGPENIVIACSTCNISKGNKMPHEWSRGNRLL